MFSSNRLTLNGLMLLLLAVFVFGLSGCGEKEAITPDTSVYQDKSFSEVTSPEGITTFEATDPEVTIVTKGQVRARRGRKWSRKNGVAHCTQGFGICTIVTTTIEINLTSGTEVAIEDLPFLEGHTWFDFSNIFENENSLTGYSQKIIFTEYMPELEEFNTFMSEDDDFVYPTEIAELFDVNALTIVGQDYPIIIDNDYEFGYVVVDVNFQ
ncbi:MAG: hypothetical protein JJT94_03745 [Bernardetiaceae bacterium]|nr:hypothetical protein [Bernardetiaceae bacterium]